MGSWGPVVRILLRYLAGILVAKGVLEAGGAGEGTLVDENFITSFEVVLGGALALFNEVWYGYVKKTGGAT